MAQCKQTAHEFIQDAFSPHVAVFCSHDADVVCRKNNLSFVQLIQPFCRLNTEVHIRDPGNITHVIRNLRVIMKDMNSLPPQPTLAKKQLNEVVASSLPPGSSNGHDACTSLPGPSNVVSVGAYDLQLSTSTPWYEAYREKFLQIMHPPDHEFTQHLLACVFVVSSNHPEPMEQFGWLTAQQHQQQHQQPHKLPKWFCPNVLRYYVLVHDVMEGQEAKAETVFQKMKTTYDMNSCHLLQINSQRSAINGNQGPGDTAVSNLPNPWSQFIPSARKSEPAQEPEEVTSPSLLLAEDVVQFPSRVAEGTTQPPANMVDSALEATEADGEVEPVIDHPLALSEDHAEVDNLSPSFACDSQNNAIPLSPSTETALCSQTHGSCLSLSDHDRLRIFVHEFVVRGLVPWAERTLRTLNDQVITRLKGIQRSLFGVTKKWFSSNKPQSQVTYSERTNVVYTSEAPEMQMRRLADLAFIFQLYEMAYQTYHAAKKDFSNDHAWLQYAAALEMASLSVFMQGPSNQRQYPSHYMESAVSTYLNDCKTPQYATRATLLNTEALKSKGMFAEAAMQLIKMTSEDSDLRSALLLEQAAHCFIRMKPPKVRKYAFHMILAGHRFSKACQRRHALRSYAQALQVYKGKDWALAEDHIHFTLGRQSFNLRHLENATSSFKHLLTVESQQTPAQQAAFLREYLFVFKQQLACSEACSSWTELPQLPLPIVDSNDTKVLCGPLSLLNNHQDVEGGLLSADESEAEADKWRRLEELLLRGRLPMLFTPSVPCRTNRTSNASSPCAVLAEPIYVEVALVNLLQVPLVMTNLSLLWRFLPRDFSASSEKPPPLITNETSDAAKLQHACDMIESSTIQELILEAASTKQLVLSLTPRHTGELHITGLGYHLGPAGSIAPAVPNHAVLDGSGGQAPVAEMTSSLLQSIVVRGKLPLEVQGPRLNNTKEEKTNKVYGPDRRLDLTVVPHMPLLQVEMSGVPCNMLSGQVCAVDLRLTNAGHLPLCNVRVACTHPKLFSLGSSCDSSDGSAPAAARSSSVDFVSSVPLEGDMLAPGQSCSVPMWLQAPNDPTKHSIDFLFYYESSNMNPKMRYRVLRHTIHIDVSASVAVKVSAHRSNQSSHTSSSIAKSSQLSSILIAVEIENLNSLLDSSVSEFSLLQVTCASPLWSLSHLSSQPSAEIKVGNMETNLLCLKADRQSETGTNDELQFSDVCFGDNKIASHKAPCIDFLYRAQSSLVPFEEVEPNPVMTASMLASSEGLQETKNPPYYKLEKALELDLQLIVFWRGCFLDSGGKACPVNGQHFLRIKKVAEEVLCPLTNTKLPVEQPPVQIIPTKAGDSPPPLSHAVASQLCAFAIRHPHCVTHHFKKTRLCTVRVHLELYNCCEEELMVLIRMSEMNENSSVSDDSSADIPCMQPSAPFSWVGHTATRLTLKAGCSKRLPLAACFSQPGTYNLSTLSVMVSPVCQPEGVPPVEEAAQGNGCPALIEIQAL